MSLLSNNSIILFAGLGVIITTPGFLNDLWRFDPLANDWYFIEGNQTLDVDGVTSSGNAYPGSRYSHTISTLSNNSIILFGGQGYTSEKEGILNELWRYDTNYCLCTNGYCDPSNETNCICDFDYFGTFCDSKCTCVNGKCNNGTLGTGLCSSCNPNYYGPNCSENCTCVQGLCDDGINGTGVCVTPSSSSSSGSISSGNVPTSKTTSPSTTKHINTESSNNSKLLPTIFIFFFFNLLLHNKK